MEGASHRAGPRVRDRVLANDPGLIRFESAARSTATILVSVLVLFGVAEAFGQPFSGILLGVLVALVAAMTFAIPDRRRRLETLLWLPLPAIGALLLGAALSRDRIAMDVGFVIVIGAGMYVARFGQAAALGGFAAIMSYFATIFFRPGFGDLGWLIASIVLGGACGLVMVMYLPPEHPARRLPRLIGALRGRLDDLLGEVGSALYPERRSRSPDERLAASAGRLADASAGAEALLADEATAARLWPELDAERLAVAIFDLQLAAERLALIAGELAASTPASSGRARDVVRDATGQVRRALPGRDAAVLEQSIARVTEAGQSLRPSGADDRATELAGHALSALQDTAGAMVELLALRAARRSESAPARRAPSGGPAAAPPHDHGGLLPTTRQAIQVSVAVALAIAVGELISPAHWSWCAITALVLFTGTQSLEDTMAKGARRLVGTVLAVPIGVLIGTALASMPGIAVPLIFVAYFLQSYLSGVSYTWAMFWMTLMLALLYGLLGSLKAGVLLTRIGETAAGAVIGIAVALMVLPTRRSELTRAAAVRYLDSLAGFVRGACRQLISADESESLAEQTRALEQRANALRTSAPAHPGRLVVRSGRGSLQRCVRVLLSGDHHARALARQALRSRSPVTRRDLADALTDAGEQVAENAESAATLVGDGEASIRSARDLIDTSAEVARTTRDEQLEGALRSLQFLDAGLASFADELAVDGAPTYDPRDGPTDATADANAVAFSDPRPVARS